MLFPYFNCITLAFIGVLKPVLLSCFLLQYCITLAFIGVLKLAPIFTAVSKNCITLAFIGVLKHSSVSKDLKTDCITLAFIGVLKQEKRIYGLCFLLYHIGVYRGIKTCLLLFLLKFSIVSHWRL